MSGAAMQTSKSVQPPLIFSANSGPPTSSAPAALASSPIALGEFDHPQRFADPVRQHNRAAHQLVGLLRVNPNRITISTVWSNSWC